jgi:anaerobic C4-dicarboxylate transporter
MYLCMYVYRCLFVFMVLGVAAMKRQKLDDKAVCSLLTLFHLSDYASLPLLPTLAKNACWSTARPFYLMVVQRYSSLIAINPSFVSYVGLFYILLSPFWFHWCDTLVLFSCTCTGILFGCFVLLFFMSSPFWWGCLSLVSHCV